MLFRSSTDTARGLHIFNYDNDSNQGINFWVGTNASKVFAARIDSSGNVGIGTDSPSNKLDVVGHIEAGSFEFNALSGTAVHGTGLRVPASQTMALHTNSQERMRIDSSGNLLVGTTTIIPSSTSTTEGISLATGSYGGFLSVSRNGGTAAAFNRMSSDGEILDFRKDGSKVGSIGTDSGYTRIVGGDGTNGSGLLFSNSKLYPVNAAGSISDNSIDIGVSTHRFKNLYLSGDIDAAGDISTNELVVDTIATIDGALTSGAITTSSSLAIRGAEIGRAHV